MITSQKPPFDAEKLKKEAIRQGLPPYFYQPIDEPLPQIPSELPSYYVDHVAKRNRKVVDYLAAHPEARAFVFFADAHIRQNAMSSVPIIRSILQNTPVRDVIYGGDTVSAWGDDASVALDMDAFDRAFAFTEVYSARGNHDMYAKRFQLTDHGAVAPNAELCRRLIEPHRSEIASPAGKTYYVLDRKKDRLRYIFVDTNEIFREVYVEDGVWEIDYSITKEQLDWFAETLLDTPEGTTVVVIGHIPMHRNLIHHKEDATVFGEIVEAYNLRKTVSVRRADGIADAYDFRSGRATVLAALSGHGHIDDSFVSPSGCLFYEIHCDAWMTNNGGSPFPREVGTVTENALDVVIVDPETKKVFAVRYGGGAALGARRAR